LRCLLAGGYCALVGYHSFQLRPLRIPLGGSLFFVFVNAYFGIKIFLQRRVNMDEDERAIHETYFMSDMNDHEFQRLIRLGERVTTTKTTRLLSVGEMHEYLYFVIDGEVDISLADESHILVRKDEFIGEGSFIGKPHKARSCVDALPGCRYVRWKLDDLKQTLVKEPHARRALEVKIGRELAHKLHGTSNALAKANHQLLVLRLSAGKNMDVDANMRRAFKEWDADGNGEFSFDEFLVMMRALATETSTQITDEQIRLLFEAVDTDGGGTISLDEFLNWVNR